jgi:hypothetical protein
MLGMRVGVEEADGDGLHSLCLARIDDRFQVLGRQRCPDAAICADALADFEAKVTRHEWFRLVELEVVHVRAVAASDLQHVAETGGCHERGLHAAPLGDGVDDDGRPVDEGDHGSRIDLPSVDGGENTVREIVGCCRDLRRPNGARHLVEDDDVGEGPADVHGHADPR